MQEVPVLVFIFGYGAMAFVISMFLAPPFIRLLHKYKLGKQMREHATSGAKAKIFTMLHQKKTGTPTMGGILIWGTVLAVVLLSRAFSYFGWIDNSLLDRNQTYLPLFALVITGLLGLVDDWYNIKGIGKTKGLSVKPKFILMTIFAIAGAYWFHYRLGWSEIHIPRVGDFDIGWWYMPLFVFIILGSANAVNITDGLDGLSGGLLILAYIAFAIIAYFIGSPDSYILASFCAVIVGALTGFLWFNVPPAKFYMGDTGAIALGATLGIIAMLTDSVLMLAVIGGVFVIETLSSIIQLTSIRLFKKKVFKIAPFHHHLEACGWSEETVVMRLWIVGAMLGVVGVILAVIGKGI